MARRAARHFVFRIAFSGITWKPRAMPTQLFAGKMYRTRASYFVSGVVSATFSLPGVESLVR
jgi:hypothetical protein